MATTTIQERESLVQRKAVIFSDTILIDFIAGRNKKSLKDLKGKINFKDDYDYKSMRN